MGWEMFRGREVFVYPSFNARGIAADLRAKAQLMRKQGDVSAAKIAERQARSAEKFGHVHATEEELLNPFPKDPPHDR